MNMFERETNNFEPPKNYKKSTIIIWLIVLIVLAVGGKLLVSYLVH